jgi:2-polyprenyl-3-methyl-5-hydroxy-6-metoxy-1,4-benzoquinol methylase
MLSKLRNYYIAAKKIYRALVAWAEYDIELLECSLSPVDKHILNAGINNDRGLFHRSYDIWRLRRCNKILEIYGVEYFKGKTILELGCGHGDIGAFFAELGAVVLCVDGRRQNVTFAKLKHRKIDNVRFLQYDLENDFSELGKFDLIIDFGLIYHLRNIERHLAACFACAGEIVMETVVCDSTDPYKVVF